MEAHGYNGPMSVFDSLFHSRRHQTPATTVDIAMHGAGYVYSDGAVGCEPTDLRIAHDGGNVAVIGLNGAGKSTLIRMIGAQESPTSGAVDYIIDGSPRDLSRRADRPVIASAVGYVDLEHVRSHFQRAKSLEDALDGYLERHHVPPAERAARIGDLFAAFDLSEVRHMHLDTLDGERLHLLAMAVACCHLPAMLVADEPTRGLDEISSAHVAQRLFRYGKPVVFTTHDVELIADERYEIRRVLVMDEAHIVFDGDPKHATDFYTQLIRSKYQSMSSR